MKLLNINILFNAFRSDAPQHAASFAFLSNARQEHEPIIPLPEVADGFIRIVTRRGLFALAAAAIDMGAKLVTADRGFAKFAGPRTQLL